MSTNYTYEIGSGLEVPGIEGKLEYGDVADYAHGRVAGSLLINDQSRPDQVHVSELSGLHDDPDVGDSRTERAGHFGERTGILLPRGRTIGVTGDVRSNNVFRMRDLWRRARAQFGRVERDLVIHPPNESRFYVNEVNADYVASWQQTPSDANMTSSIAAFTDGFLTGSKSTFVITTTSAFTFYSRSATAIAWNGEDLWMTAIVDVSAAPATPTSISLGAYLVNSDGSFTIWTATGAGTIATPVTGTYYLLTARMAASTVAGSGAAAIRPAVIMPVPSSLGTYEMRVARMSAVLLGSDETSPLGFLDASLPGFETEGVFGQSRSYGPCHTVNQFSNPDSTTSIWVNDSTSGATVDVAGTVVRNWPGGGRAANSFSIRNPNTTSRTLAVRYPVTLADPNLFVVAGGRNYRVHLRLLVSESFTTGRVTVAWLDKAGATISSSTIGDFNAVAPGGLAQDVDIDGVAFAPALAVRAYVRIASLTPSTTTNNKLTLLIADPRFTDCSEFDIGADVAVDSTTPPELGVVTSRATRSGSSLIFTATGARRRIPRPFLLRKVRALWDGKAPESQRNLQARRDFTMSLRASDPRIYVLDQLRAFFRATVAATLNSFLGSTFTALLNTVPPLVASDDFTATTAGSALNARTAPLGGAWATSGATTDLAFADDLSGEQIKRSTTSDASPRFAVLGSTNYTNKLVRVSAYRANAVSSFFVEQGVIARWVDASNFLRATVKRDSAGNITFAVIKKIAGTDTTIGTFSVTASSLFLIYFDVIMTVYASGRVIAMVTVIDSTSHLETSVGTIKTSDATLATGGTLASGKPGIYDYSTGSLVVNRYYDNFKVSVPAADPAGAPPNFTFESDTSLGAAVQWKPNRLGSTFPLEGTGLGPSEPDVTPAGYLTQDSLVRMYYSGGSTTYTTPEVTVSGGNIVNAVADPDYDLFVDSLIGGSWQYNYLGVLLKRVSATTWIEARFNSANQAVMNAAHGSPAAPFSLELWCSHNAAGSAAVTRLGGWDVPAANIIDGHRKHLHAFMDQSGVVYVELWDEGGPTLTEVGLIARQSYTLPGPLSTLLGPAVAGRTGVVIKLARWDDGTLTGISVAKMAANYGEPYLSTFEATDYATALGLISCPVIGDVDDVPLQLQLRGDIDSPVIKVANIDTGESSFLSLSGVFAESDPVTVDMDAGTIRSASGLDYFGRRQLGSRFFSFKPGRNFITIQAKAWNTSAPAHVIATWRNALK